MSRKSSSPNIWQITFPNGKGSMTHFQPYWLLFLVNLNKLYEFDKLYLSVQDICLEPDKDINTEQWMVTLIGAVFRSYLTLKKSVVKDQKTPMNDLLVLVLKAKSYL